MVVFDGYLRRVAVGVLPQADLDGGATELHVCVAHTPGESAIGERTECPRLLVGGPALALEVGVGPLVVRGELVELIHDVLLEHLEEQGEADFAAFKPGKIGAIFGEGEVGEAGLAEE